MLEIKVNNGARVEIDSSGTAKSLWAELVMVIAALQRHNPIIFNKKAILLCVDLADKIKPDDEIEEEKEENGN